ncbi:hypothetical protein QBC46DRAFT_369102 [Diplogelasinospora grovesii]|uniref:Uncharacterized protein n=1 Tax=Diplogelasinospora grovesii TaxID=303347 RepID=A0AAN6NJD4_9PEZI|nr:hypothetical protein QBC46DRAFT_369102 [Diplogelasinospora grovesii]
MDTIVQYILDQSKLDVTLIGIKNATHDSFHLSIESRVTGTGPIGATMAPMEVDLTFDKACFGKLMLPEVRTRPGGTQVNIYDQPIKIINMAAFKRFVESLMRDEHLVLTLDNGACTIKAMFLTGRCTYRKDVHIKGMNGPPTKISRTDEGTNILAVHNQSPLEIDHGVSLFEIRDGDTVLAELKGPMQIKRGGFEFTQNITRRDKPVSASNPTGNVLLVGTGVEDNSAWTNETLKYIRTPLELTDKFVSLYT